MTGVVTIPPAERSPAAPERELSGPPAAGVRWRLVAAASALMAIVFFVVEHDVSVAGQQFEGVREDRIADRFIDSIESGNTLRKLVLTVYGLGGVAALLRVRERPWNVHRLGGALLAATLVWTAASVTWSIDPALTWRRLGASGMILVGSLGYARLLRPDELLAVAAITFPGFAATSFALDLAAGGKPWGANYRFGGTMHPNIQAAYCGMACLATYCLPLGGWKRWVPRGAFGMALALLFLTESRTSVLAMLIGLGIASAVRLDARVRWYAGCLALACLGAVTVLVSSLGEGQRKSLGDVALLGRTEQAGSLTGRVPLWRDLAGFVAEAPLRGFGYESFWVPDHIEAILKSQKWALQSAHNAYFEVVLQLGLVGLCLGLGTVVVAFNRTQFAFSRTRSVGYAFAYGVIGFALVNSLLESHFAKLKYPTVVALVTVLGVLMFGPREGPQPARRGGAPVAMRLPLNRPAAPRDPLDR